MYRLNRVVLRGHPCLRPVRTEKAAAIPLSQSFDHTCSVVVQILQSADGVIRHAQLSQFLEQQIAVYAIICSRQIHESHSKTATHSSSLHVYHVPQDKQGVSSATVRSEAKHGIRQYILGCLQQALIDDATPQATSN